MPESTSTRPEQPSFETATDTISDLLKVGWTPFIISLPGRLHDNLEVKFWILLPVVFCSVVALSTTFNQKHKIKVLNIKIKTSAGRLIHAFSPWRQSRHPMNILFVCKCCRMRQLLILFAILVATVCGRSRPSLKAMSKEMIYHINNNIKTTWKVCVVINSVSQFARRPCAVHRPSQ